MANDRLWLQCRHCGSQKLLAKYYPSLEWERPDTGSFEAWLRKHMRCAPPARDQELDLRGERCFDIVAESDPEYVITFKDEDGMPTSVPPGEEAH